MMKGRWGLVMLGVMLVPALAWAGRVFQWTDKEGQVHITDNLYELPAQVRDKYLQKIEDEARKKYTADQIKDLKEKGDWPPMELIRPPSLKASAGEMMGFQIVGSDAEARRAINEEFTFQWESFYAERKEIDEVIRQAEPLVKQAEEAVEKAKFEDMVNGRVGDMAVAPKAQKALEMARKALEQARVAKSGLAAKESALLTGQRAYFHAGEDGGPATFR